MQRLGRVGAVLSLVWPVSAASAQFFEGFDGSSENAWGTFPFAPVTSNDGPFIFFDGFPQGTFTTVDGEGVFLMSNTLEQLHYVGMSPDSLVLDGSEDRIELRFNTMATASQASSGPITLRVASPGGPKVSIGLFVGSAPSSRRIRSGSTIDDDLTTSTSNWTQNTWYRLVFDGTGPLLRAMVLRDDGTTLFLREFTHTFGNMQQIGGGSALYVVVTQDAFTPQTPITPAVAIDWVRVVECAANLAGSGTTLDVFDVLAFLALFDAMDPAADLAPPGGDGVFNIFDVLAYLELFDEGC